MPARCSWPLAFRSAARARGGTSSGEDIARRQAEASAEVPGAQLHEVQPLRASACRVQEVRPVPHLPARARAPGRHSRHDQVQLVGEDVLTDPIADMLARIRNANKALHEKVEMPTSKMKVE